MGQESLQKSNAFSSLPIPFHCVDSQGIVWQRLCDNWRVVPAKYSNYVENYSARQGIVFDTSNIAWTTQRFIIPLALVDEWHLRRGLAHAFLFFFFVPRTSN